MVKPRMGMAPVVLWGAAMIAGTLFLHSAAGAADTPNSPGQMGTSVNTPAVVRKLPLPGNPPQATLPPGGKAGRLPANQQPQVVPPAGGPNAGPAPTIEVTKDDRISADIKARPLSEALRAMADKKLFDIRGPMPAGEEITAQFSGLTLDQALKKLMRGYNYVLMDQGISQKPVLVLIGRIQRSSPGEQPSPAQAIPPAVDVVQPPAQTPSTMPPAPVNPLQRAGNRRYPVAGPEGNAVATAPAGAPLPGVGPNGPPETDMSTPPQVQGQSAGQVPVAGPIPAAGQPGLSGQAQPPGQDQPAQDGASGTRRRDTLGSF